MGSTLIRFADWGGASFAGNLSTASLLFARLCGEKCKRAYRFFTRGASPSLPLRRVR